MADKFPPARADNFKLLDPTAPRTQRIIQAALTVNVPWQPEEGPVWQPSKVVEIAARIDDPAAVLPAMLSKSAVCQAGRAARTTDMA